MSSGHARACSAPLSLGLAACAALLWLLAPPRPVQAFSLACPKPYLRIRGRSAPRLDEGRIFHAPPRPQAPCKSVSIPRQQTWGTNRGLPPFWRLQRLLFSHLAWSSSQARIKCHAVSRALVNPLALITMTQKLPGMQLLLASPWYVWTVLLFASTFGVRAERTRLGSALSSPLITMAVSLLACNLGLLPATSDIYGAINKYLVPLAIPLLLLDADLKKVLTMTGPMLNAFVVGSVGTVVGTILAFFLLPMNVGPDGWKIAAALCSRHIGGAVNYVAVTETLHTSAELIAAGIAADNLVVSLYFGLLFAVARDIPAEEDDAAVEESEEEEEEEEFPPDEELPEILAKSRAGQPPGLGFLKALFTSSLICMIGTAISEGPLKGSISSLPIISLVSIMAATLFPRQLSKITEPGGQVAVVCMNLFFAVTGASGLISRVLNSAPRLFLFSVVQLLGHYGFLMAFGRYLFRMPLRELLVASNANVGGPTTAAAMAGSKNWKSLILPGLLTGILGYATGTFIGLFLGRGLLVSMVPLQLPFGPSP